MAYAPSECCTGLMCFDIATENLDTKIYREVSHSSLWYNVPQKGKLKMGAGTNFTTYGYSKIEPTAAPAAWTKIDISNGSSGITSDGNFCCQMWTDIATGWMALNYNPEYTSLRGPVVCEKQLLFNHNIEDFLKAYVEEITKRARREWEMIYKWWHRRLSRKLIVREDLEGSVYDQLAMTGLPAATGELTQEVLEWVANWLNQDGAMKPDDNGYITVADNDPIYTLGIHQMQSLKIRRNNSELRKDFRWGDPNMLLARLGSSTVIGNFRHLIDQMPSRYTWAAGGGGTYTEVAMFEADTETSWDTECGTQYKINDDWKNAPYEGADVICPDLFTSELPTAKNSAAGMTFGDNNYMGDWQFVVGAYKWMDATCDLSTDKGDPLNERGRHYTQFIHAPKPNPTSRWKHGYHIIYKRCLGNKITITTCSS